MRSSRTLTIFSEQRDEGRSGTSFVVSILVHAAVFGVVSYGLLNSPRIVQPKAEHYVVRRLDLRTPKEEMRQAAGTQIQYPGPARVARARAPGGRPAIHPPVLREMARAERGPQTLIQPDLPAPVVLKIVAPAPTVEIWTPAKVPVKTIVAPLPTPPTAADVTPTLAPPNNEVNLADVELSSSNFPTQKLDLFPSTTSPVMVKGPAQVQMAPATATQTTETPTPATVVSLSDLIMPNGMVMLPEVNETDAKALPGPMTPGQTKDLTMAGSGNPSSPPQRGGGTGAGQDAGAKAGEQEALSAAGKTTGAGSGAAEGAVNGTGTANGQTADSIALPRDGQFGSVIVGDSLEDEFPEVANVWSGRIAYTVYLHVGLAKSWILQYSLPAAAEAAAAGEAAQLEPPWPYNIVRPNLASGSIDADALLVHGFVNQSGRFESLAVAFPPDFRQAQFVLDSLRQWQFRPATENGQAAKVEVLLIVPSEMDSGMLRRPRATPRRLVRLVRALGLIAPKMKNGEAR
ncbi:MAG: hypothetical protein ACRD3N_03715 [Terracidiphilus sp.]